MPSFYKCSTSGTHYDLLFRKTRKTDLLLRERTDKKTAPTSLKRAE